MEEPDVSLERIFEAGLSVAGFKMVAGLPVFGAVLLSAPARFAAGADRFSDAVFTADFCAADFCVVFAAGLFFAVVFGALATAFAGAAFVAVLSVFVMVFASLRAADFRIDLPTGLVAGLAFGGGAVPAAIFLAPLALALFAADLVTVAFMASSFQ